MSSPFGDEPVFSMPPVSKAILITLAEAFLDELAPEMLEAPCQLDLVRLIETDLQTSGIHVQPASVEELGDNLAVTDPSGMTDINILLREDLWDELYQGGRRANRARATVAHELGHAILHVPIIRRRRSSPHSRHLLARVASGSVPTYMSSEWQAWMLGGCILAPLRTLKTVQHLDPWTLAQTYGMSPAMMKAHLKRLRMLWAEEGL
jgi:hypothetical protein